MRPRLIAIAALLLSFLATAADARLVKFHIERRENILNGKSFGLAGVYEKLIGKAEFALDPSLPINKNIVDLNLAPRNAQGEVEFTADFYMLKPLDSTRGNGRLFYEVGNRGGKSMLRTFQKAKNSADPEAEADFGDGALMNQGYTLLWMGWQWDVPDGQMRMDMPIVSNHGKPITGLVRGNFIPNNNAPTQPLADRNHRAYPIDDPASAENVMTVRNRPTDTPQIIPHSKWHFVGDASVAVDGGFELGRIYDVVYRARDPRVGVADIARDAGADRHRLASFDQAGGLLDMQFQVGAQALRVEIAVVGAQGAGVAAALGDMLRQAAAGVDAPHVQRAVR